MCRGWGRVAGAVLALAIIGGAALVASPAVRAAGRAALDTAVTMWKGRLGATAARVLRFDDRRFPTAEHLRQAGVEVPRYTYTRVDSLAEAAEKLGYQPAKLDRADATLERVMLGIGPTQPGRERRAVTLTYRIGDDRYYVDTYADYFHQGKDWRQQPISDLQLGYRTPEAPTRAHQVVKLGGAEAVCMKSASSSGYSCAWLQDGKLIGMRGPKTEMVLDLARSIAGPK